MRKYLLILFLSLCAASNAQFAPTSAKTRFVNGTALGTRDSSAYAANDSLVVVINRQGRMMYRSTDGYWKILSNAAASDYVPYTGAVASVNLGEFRLSSRSVATDSILARSSAGGRIVSNSGTVISEYGRVVVLIWTFMALRGIMRIGRHRILQGRLRIRIMWIVQMH
jgi:hypothetical protein